MTGAKSREVRTRKRVLVSAYACAPGLDEPEAGAGWAFGRAAAVEHDVWIITRPRFAPAIAAALADDPELAEHLRVIYLDLSPRMVALKKRPGSIYWYYALWQRELGRRAADLHADLDFDVLHHVTFAVDWQFCGLAKLARTVPLVWGPVGGATYQPWGLASWLGPRGIVGEIVRTAFTKTARRVWGDPIARRAALVVAQNADDARRFSQARRVVLEGNSAFIDLPARTTKSSTGRQAIFVGRLIPWKGAALAIATLSEPQVRDWKLDIYGTGPELARLQRLVAERALTDRVTFKGHQPRASVLAALDQADVLLFPSMHDSAPWAVAEASSCGLPVVCFDIGGPPLLAGTNGYVVKQRGKTGKNVTRNLADALSRAGETGGRPHDRWSATRLPALLANWYGDSMGSRDQNE